jgi:hypothetical protein
LTPAGKGKNIDSDAFIWKLTTSGNYVSVWQIGSTQFDSANNIVLDESALYIQGDFNGTVDFDLGSGVQTRTGPNKFIARYTTSGTLSWVQMMGAGSYLTDDANFLYLSGGFSQAFDLDPGPGISTLTPTGTDSFVAKYSKTNGSFNWGRQFGGVASEMNGPCLTDPTTGAIYVSMNYTDATIDLNPSQPGGEYTNAGGSDGLLVKLDTGGAYLNSWTVASPGGEGGVWPIGILNGTIYASGRFEQTASFPVGGPLTSSGGTDLYLMAIDDPATVTRSLRTNSAPASTKPYDPLAGVFLGGVPIEDLLTSTVSSVLTCVNLRRF